MIKINNFITDLFLKNYYFFEVVCGEHLSKEERYMYFAEYASVFTIKDKDFINEMFNISESEEFLTLRDLSAYERFIRISEYASKTGKNIELMPLDKLILANKREAIIKKYEIFANKTNMTKDYIAECLLDSAMNGNIYAMLLRGFLEYHGILVTEDRHNALKRFRLCAEWNNIFGNLLCMSYDIENKEKYFMILYTILRNESQKEVFSFICKGFDYPGCSEINYSSDITEKAFRLGITDRNRYDLLFARIANSDIISVEDKKNLLLYINKNSLALLGDFPFDAVCDDILEFSPEYIENCVIKRNNETDIIIKNLIVAARCPNKVYKPLLIESSEDFMIMMYSDALKKSLSTECFIETDAASFIMRDFSSDKDNILIRSLSETKNTQTVFLIRGCEALDTQKLNELIKILDYDYRNRFKIFNPHISLDLSDMKFILFSNSPIRELENICDTVRSENLDSNEKKIAIREIFRKLSYEYCLENLSYEEECTDILSHYDSSMFVEIINESIRNSIYENSEKITVNNVVNICNKLNIHKNKSNFGFSGGF